MSKQVLTQQVRLAKELVASAEVVASVASRTMPKQIEHWAKIGRVMEENRDLTYEFVLEAMLAKSEIDNGEFVKYERRKTRNRGTS